MNKHEIQEAITATLDEIMKVKEQIAQAEEGSKEQRRLRLQLKELQYLQLWHIEQYGNLEK